jgi:hypothetical protein
MQTHALACYLFVYRTCEINTTFKWGAQEQVQWETMCAKTVREEI